MTSVAIGLLSLGGDHRILFQIIPQHIKKSWNEWALGVLIIISIASQIVLSLLGSVRKYNPRTRIKITLWCAYLLANSVASAALGIITQTALDVCRPSALKSFWAPFLLIHIGGPDTITAYSLEDNELWLRHFVEMVFQSLVGLYILLLSWSGCSRLPSLSLLVYVSGFIKCYERVRALRLANTEHLRDSMLGSPDPGPNYAKFMEEFQLKKSQGFIVSVEEIPEVALPVTVRERGGREISEAFDLFQTFKRLFVDIFLTFEERDKSQSYFRPLDSFEAFSVVEIELGFAYDMLYTKACAVYTLVGFIFRLTSISLLLTVLFCFCFLCDVEDYRVIDIAITVLLIATALIMEVFAVITMLRSDWTDHWLTQHKYTRNILIFPFLKQPTKQRWSNKIAQLDLLSVAFKEKPASFLPAQKFLGIDNYRVRHRYKTYTIVSKNLKYLIYEMFKKSCSSDPKALCNRKGSFSLRKNKCDSLEWSITDVEFDQSILIWHIATALCYYSDVGNNDQVNRMESKHISDYLLYLLVAYPDMLPIGIGMIRYRDTCADAKRFYKDKESIDGVVTACKKLLEVKCREVPPSKVIGDRSKSVLFDGCFLAQSLKEKARMWEVISDVWIEILVYAATHCRGLHHNQQLHKGGEFLTHVWLLMAHLGITEQIHVSQGHARAKLNVS